MQKQGQLGQAGAYQLFYEDHGTAEQAVVMLHGIPTHSFLWHQIIPFVSQQFRVIAPDLLGYGASPPAPTVELSLPRQAQHILALLDSLDIRQAHFVGHDLGGGIAQIIAVHHPERMLSLTITDGVCFSNWPVPTVTALRWPAAPEFEPSAAVVQEMLRLGVYNPQVLTADVIAAFLAPFLGTKGWSSLQLAATALEHHQTEELVPHLGAIQIPTTVLWGQHDRLLPAYWGRRLSKAIPNAQFHLLQGCGHFTMLDNPALLASHLLDHLRRATEHPGIFLGILERLLPGHLQTHPS